MEISVLGILDPYSLRNTLNYQVSDTARFFNRLRSIERRGYIEIKKDSDSQLSITLTNKGQAKLLESPNNNAVDGKWRIISFDIPEKIRNKRNMLRRIIKKIGFKQVQKSLWVCPYNKADKIQIVFDELDINKYVAYFVAEKTDINDYLSRKFKLNGQ